MTQADSIDIPSELIYVSDEQPGFTRIRDGEAVFYLDEEGKELLDKRLIGRIKALVIPPNWTDTWICKLENGHLQATGRDQRGRKQYLYHEDWLAYRQQSKFDRMKEFGYCLPQIRSEIGKFLSYESFTRDKVLALAVKLLDVHYLRIGNDFYLSENETYGLTTLRRKHFDTDGEKLKLSYKAKSNKSRTITITNPKVVKLLSEINELPGYEVFRYKEGGSYHQIDSSDVNQFIQRLAGDQFTAKDFRTWGGTVNAVEFFPEAKKDVATNPRKKLEPAIVNRVAKILGNTVATARDYYIHPEVLAYLLSSEGQISTSYSPEPYLKESEKTVLQILENN